jgi:glycosyltransferase involved in cell wall biosynthesis
MALRPRWKSLLALALRPALSLLDITLARYSDRVVANSRFTASQLERIYGLTTDAIASPGIDFGSFSAEHGRKELSIITVGRLTRFKRVDFLLRVFREVLKIHPGLTYHIVGTGDEEKALRECAGQLGVASRVVFHGAVTAETLAGLCRRSTLFLHGSIDEPFGMAPLEAIASGTPVVAHCSGGPQEFVTADCGRLIDSVDVAVWAREVVAYMAVLTSDPDTSSRVRACAHRFDWPLALRPAVEIIAGLCAGDSPASRNPVGKLFPGT